MLGDRWHNLSRTATVSYDGDSLASIVARVVPLCGMEYLTSKGFQSGEMNIPWSGKAPYSSEEDGALSRHPLFSHRVNELNLPYLLFG